MPPVILSFHDQDSNVRYYACEALYNIAKVSLNHMVINYSVFLIRNLNFIAKSAIFIHGFIIVFLDRLYEESSLNFLIRYLMHSVSFQQIQMPVFRVLLIFLTDL